MVTSLTRLPILLVEETPSLLFVYRSVLTAAGMQVHPASSAAEALQLFHQVRPGVVVLDLMLPDRDGLALMSEMLAINPELCVVVMSAQSSVDRAVAAMRAGAFDFLLKPFEENRFLAADFRDGAGENARNPAGSIAETGRDEASAMIASYVPSRRSVP